MLKIAARIAFLALLAAMPVSAADIHGKNPALGEVIHTLFAGRDFSRTAISPDGKQVAWVERLVDKNGMPNGNAAIYVSGIKRGSKTMNSGTP